MKSTLRFIYFVAISAIPATSCLAQPAIPVASIGIMVSPMTVNIGQTFTVTCRLDSYRGTAEIDGYAFSVPYDETAFAPVPGSFYLGAASGPDMQFLAKANQETAVEGYMLTNQCDASQPGFVYVTVSDLGPSNPERGSTAQNGFLVSFQMTALAHGTRQLSPTPYIDNSVLYNTSLQPVGTVTFGSATVIVPNPTAVVVQAADANASEPGTDTGMFLFTRTGPTNAPLILQFSIAGSSVNGSDYAQFSNSVWLAAGSASAALVVAPVDDAEIEGDETVTLTLQSSRDYDISGTGTAAVVIHDDENPAPTVVLTSPPNGTIFPRQTNITLTATASDANGSVTNVEFFKDGTIKLGEDSSAPYSFTWTNAPTGVHVLSARATDNLNATGDSVPIAVIVRGPPTVAITSPTNGASFGSTAGISINATATDADGVITFLELDRDGAVFAATNGGNLSTVWSNAPVGNYTLTARASDDNGLLATSGPVAITVTASGLADMYASRPRLNGCTNSATGNNSSFSKEVGEPNHAGRVGGHSAWVAWTAPVSGTCTMDTEGSDFDTVLAVYTNAPGTDTVSNLLVVASNDDADTDVWWSRVVFNATAGRTYAIAVDGYNALAIGTINLHIALPNTAPVITASPQSLVRAVGQTAAFSVSASGPPVLNYQWRRNGTNLSGATASTLTITNLQESLAGYYSAVVSNSGGSATSAPAVLMVLAGPVFTVVPTTQVVEPGGTATFAAGATGSAPLTYQWSFNGTLMPGEYTSSFTRYNAQHADGGIYSVMVANAAGSTNAGAELIVCPVFTSLTSSNNTLLLNWHGTTGKVYVIEGTTNLTPSSTSWTTLGTVTNTALTGQFPLGLTNAARVIRLRVAP